jgi:biotin transporter BioY
MVVLYFLPMFIAIAVLVGSFARRNKSGQRPSGLLIVAGLLLVVALGGLAFWLAEVVR